MNNKIIKQVLIGVLFCFSSIFCLTTANTAEVDNGIVIVDRKPWKISWIQEGKDWILIAHFDKGTLKTYFKDEPPAKGFGLSRNKKPTKQEFESYLGKFTSTNCQYEQWPDGAKAYAFKYKQIVEREGQKCNFGTTAVVEEVGEAENEIRYSLFRVF